MFNMTFSGKGLGLVSPAVRRLKAVSGGVL